ncbi:MAG: hypothetical protein AAFQ58_07535 [Pseudomonadota bacterium]
MVFAVAATALQWLAESQGWLGGMRIWSIDRGFSAVPDGIAFFLNWQDWALERGRLRARVKRALTEPAMLSVAWSQPVL